MDKRIVDFELAVPSTPEEFEAYYRFRWQLLREPWGQPSGSERDETDAASDHLLARTASGEIIGVGRLHFPDASTGQIRFMATAESCRFSGVGRAIVERLERIAEEHGARVMIINAREPAVPFYEALGYSVCGEGQLLFGEIRHKKMQKALRPRP